jgi:hypothetical protein
VFSPFCQPQGQFLQTKDLVSASSLVALGLELRAWSLLGRRSAT